MALLDPIDRLVGEEAYEQVRTLTEDLRSLSKTFKEVHDSAKVIEFKPGNTKGLREQLATLKEIQDVEIKLARTTSELAVAVDEYRKMVDRTALSKAKLSALSSEEAKENAATKVAIREKNKELMSEAEALDESFQARQRANQAEKERQEIDRQAAKELKELQQSVKETNNEFEKLSKDNERRARKAEKLAKTQEEKEQRRREIQELKDLAKAQKELDAEIKKSQKETEKQLKLAERLSNAYNKLTHDHTNLYKEAQRIGAEFGVESEQFKKAAAEANKLDDKLKKIDAALGSHRRNVGNYSSAWNGLSFSITQIARELPTLANGLQLFVVAVGNNVGMIQDEIRMLKARNAELRASGQATESVSKQILKSVFSWTTFLPVVITLLTVFGPKLAEAFTGGGKAASDAEKANKKYRESLESIAESSRSTANQEIAHMNVLITVAKNSEQSTRTRLKAVKELQETYPETFGALSKQAILEGQLGDAVNKTTQALLNRAAFQAAEKKYAAASERVYDLTVAQRKATEELTKAEAARRKSDAPNKDAEARGLEQFTAIEKAGRARKTLSDINKDIAEATKEQMMYLKDAKDFAQKAGSVLFGKDTGTTKAPRQFDSTNAEIRGQEDLNKALNDFAKQRVETEMAANKAIYEDDSRSLAERMESYDQYVQGLLQLQVIQENQELNAIQVRLDKIAAIEKKEEKKRTNQEKSLLLDKEALLLQESTLVEKYALARQEVLSAAEKEALNIAKSYGQARAREIQQQIQQTKNVWSQWESDQLKRLNESYEKQQITTKEFYREQRRISKQAKEQEYAALVEWLRQQSDAIQNSTLPDDVKNMIKSVLDNAIAEFSKPVKPERQGRSLLDYLGFGKKDIEQQKQEVARQIEDLYNTIFASIEASRNAYYEKQFGLLDQQQKQVEDQAAAEKAAIESSLLSEQEKERKLKEIDNERLAREKALDQQRKALQREQAIRQKQDAIFQASMNAGIAIAKVFAGMGTGPGAVALAIAQAALIAAQTAANIAMISSRPVPEYWKGTPAGGHQGGPAWVGERGIELGLLPDGTSFLTPSTATVMDLPRGTDIIPHHELVRAANETTNADFKRYSRELIVVNGDNDDVKAAIIGLGKQFDESIKNLPVHNTIFTKEGIIWSVTTANGTAKFLNGGKSWSSFN